jgi:hypothetical protein
MAKCLINLLIIKLYTTSTSDNLTYQVLGHACSAVSAPRSTNVVSVAV